MKAGWRHRHERIGIELYTKEALMRRARTHAHTRSVPPELGGTVVMSAYNTFDLWILLDNLTKFLCPWKFKRRPQRVVKGRVM